jgi:hypothetical protein
MDRDYYSDPRRKVRTAVARTLARPLRSAGFELEVRSFYSPIPDLRTIEMSVWTRPSELPGLPVFDLAAQLSFVERELGARIAEFQPPREPTQDRFEFFLSNGLYQGGDADLLYAMVRRYRPKRVIELGAGFSTLVTAAACSANRADGHDTEFISYDPYATPAPGLDGLSELRPVPAESVPIEEFESLNEDDILFIDSSHVVRVGGDVNRLLLEVVPRLSPGVLIHLHDIFLPWEYPREWIANGWFWSEQHLLHALLVGNAGLEVLVAAHGLWRAHEQQLRTLIPNIDPARPPISFWMRRSV